MKFFKRKRIGSGDISPDEIFLDASNLPGFDTNQFEGQIEKAISFRVHLALGIVFALVLFIFVGRLWFLQIDEGQAFAEISENNRLQHKIIFADRGIIYDKNENPLAWNEAVDDQDFNSRKYIKTPGFSSLLGFINYPQKDGNGYYFTEEFEAREGVEKFYNERLSGLNGVQLIESDARGNIFEGGIIERAKDGESIHLSIDKRLQEQMYKYISELAPSVGFKGGTGLIMDIETGELLTYVNYPEYDSQILTDGTDNAKIAEMINNPNNPFLDRAADGLFTPGSIIKTFVALGALNENVIDPTKSLLSEKYLVVPNPYDPNKPTLFADWKAHGWVNLYEALAYSSNSYFYQVGGGYEDQKGLGIERVEKYIKAFGFGREIATDLFSGTAGTVPNPQWKEKTFSGDPWRIGDTYYTSIGQYGFQITPLQALRAISGVAKNGIFIEPTLLSMNYHKYEPQFSEVDIHISERHYSSVKRGLREGVLYGTAKAVNVDYVDVAAKTGTAELGVSKDFVNSWIIGYYPYQDPKYAFTVMMESGPRTNLVGASSIMRQILDWIYLNAPEYLE